MSNGFKPVKKGTIKLVPNNTSDFVYTGSFIEKKLEKLMKMNLNVLLIGRHGAGKTTLIEAAAAKCGLVVGYFSVPNTDPYADLAGIPIVDKKSKTVEFSFNMLLDQYDIIFFDELNRVQHPKMQGAFLELIQKRSINGRKFERLKMVWGAMNPPNQEYAVNDLDPTVLDRFHEFISLDQRPDASFFTKRFNADIATTLIDWWSRLSEDQRKHVSPRRLEYVCDIAIKTGFDDDLVFGAFVPGTVTASNINILLGKLKPLFNGTKPQGDGLLDSFIGTQRGAT